MNHLLFLYKNYLQKWHSLELFRQALNSRLSILRIALIKMWRAEQKRMFRTPSHKLLFLSQDSFSSRNKDRTVQPQEGKSFQNQFRRKRHKLT